MLILGLDPGTHVTGWGLVEAASGQPPRHVDHGCIRTVTAEALDLRLYTIDRALSDIFGAHTVAAMAIETSFVAENPQTALKLGHARGVAMVCARRAGADVFEYAPSRVKSAVAGSGRAEKRQVAEMVRVITGLSEVPPADAADALALAICHALAQAGRLPELAHKPAFGKGGAAGSGRAGAGRPSGVVSVAEFKRMGVR
jgi:crossover junction endodeoxyribonuclease RuvC